jgi:hypothetical protein
MLMSMGILIPVLTPPHTSITTSYSPFPLYDVSPSSSLLRFFMFRFQQTLVFLNI